MLSALPSLIPTVTVGPGISPGLPRGLASRRLAGSTAGGDLAPRPEGKSGRDSKVGRTAGSKPTSARGSPRARRTTTSQHLRLHSSVPPQVVAIPHETITRIRRGSHAPRSFVASRELAAALSQRSLACDTLARSPATLRHLSRRLADGTGLRAPAGGRPRRGPRALGRTTSPRARRDAHCTSHSRRMRDATCRVRFVHAVRLNPAPRECSRHVARETSRGPHLARGPCASPTRRAGGRTSGPPRLIRAAARECCGGAGSRRNMEEPGHGFSVRIPRRGGTTENGVRARCAGCCAPGRARGALARAAWHPTRVASPGHHPGTAASLARPGLTLAGRCPAPLLRGRSGR